MQGLVRLETGRRSRLPRILKASRIRGDARTRKIPARVSSVNADAALSLLCWRAVPARLALIAALFAGGTACGPGGPAVGGARSFAEIDVPTAIRSLADDQARLVQVRDPAFADPRIEDAAFFGEGESVPEAWLAEARPILVIAHDESSARRLAARLLRLGAVRVSVVRGGIGAWSGSQDTSPDLTRVGLSNAVDAKPSQREPARRNDPWQQSQK